MFGWLCSTPTTRTMALQKITGIRWPVRAWFFCRITMLRLLRLSTNKAVMGGVPYTTAEAWQAYRKVAGIPEVGFVAETPGIESAMEPFTQSKGFSHADWTDAYLAGFARLAGLRLVSFDNGFSKYKELSWQLLA
jgi:predicted nucleic acid-binding protein